MSVPVSFDELLAAYEWVSAGGVAALDCEAYVNRETGTVHWFKNELDLGRSLAIRFMEEHLPRSRETVYGFFRKPGAYSHLKSFLAHAGQLDAWHAYEQTPGELAVSPNTLTPNAALPCPCLLGVASDSRKPMPRACSSLIGSPRPGRLL